MSLKHWLASSENSSPMSRIPTWTMSAASLALDANSSLHVALYTDGVIVLPELLWLLCFFWLRRSFWTDYFWLCLASIKECLALMLIGLLKCARSLLSNCSFYCFWHVVFKQCRRPSSFCGFSIGRERYRWSVRTSSFGEYYGISLGFAVIGRCYFI